MTLLNRADQPEIMDLEALSEREAAGVIKFLDRVNRWFGGHSLILKYLDAWTSDLPKNLLISVLDVGTGSGDLPLALSQWAQQQGRRLRIVGLEKSPGLAELARYRCARTPAIEIRTGDLFDQTEHFDFVFSNLVLHHIAPVNQVDFLRRAAQLASCGVLMADLERSWLNLLAVGAASFLWGNRVVRNDGPLSVRRSFTVEESRRLAQETGLKYLSARREAWCRLSVGGLKK